MHFHSPSLSSQFLPNTCYWEATYKPRKSLIAVFFILSYWNSQWKPAQLDVVYFQRRKKIDTLFQQQLNSCRTLVRKRFAPDKLDTAILNSLFMVRSNSIIYGLDLLTGTCYCSNVTIMEFHFPIMINMKNKQLVFHDLIGIPRKYYHEFQ